jgi:hypothetical protein
LQDYKTKQYLEYRESNPQEKVKKGKKKQKMMINQKQAHQKLEDCLQIKIRIYNLVEADKAPNQEGIKISKD